MAAVDWSFGSVVEELAGPAGVKLSLALLHFLWQGVLIAAVAAVLMRVLGRRSANRRYAIGVAGIALMGVAPVVTFCVVEPPEGLPAFAASADLMAEVDRLEGLIASMEGGSWEAGEMGDGGTVVAPPLTWAERVRLLQPYALLLWLAGTGVFALRLGFGVRASRRFGRGRRPLPEAWVRIAAEVAARVGLKAPRIFLSDNVAEAVAVGLLRPMVLIPAAWLGRIPPEVLEAVLAHELAHLRRYDLWVNLLQRCVEAALFYHPAVWWLSRRVRVEREYCCDETAALAVTGRAAYARALEFVATEAVEARRRAARRPASWSPALAAGMGGEPMALLERVRRVLGAEGGPPRGNWMSEGLLALAVPAALWAGIATVGPAVASADEKEEELIEVSEDVAEASEEETVEGASEEGGDVLIFRNEDVLIEREPGEEGAGDVLILRDGEEGPFEVRLDTNGVPMLKDIPIVGRLFEKNDLDVELRGDVLIARSEDAEEETEEGGEETEEEDDLREALRELRAEMKALRGEVEGLRSGKDKPADVRSKSPRDREIEVRLEKPVSLDLKQVPLSKLIGTLRDAADVNFVVDVVGLEEEGVASDHAVTVDVKEVPIAGVLNIALEPLNLGYVVENNVVKVTSRTRMKGPLHVEAYQVADLVAPLDGEGADKETADDDGPRIGKRPRGIDFDSLVEQITGTIEPNSWEHVGGQGVIRKNETTLSLIVRQTPDVHDEIASLLKKLRREVDGRTLDVPRIKLKEGRGEALGEVRRDFERRPPKAPGVPGPPKPPIPPGALDIEEHVARPGWARMILRKPDPNGEGPERFEVRILRKADEGAEKGGLGPDPEKVIERLRIEHADGKPRVFLFREGKDGKPEKVEGRAEGDESVIELESGRVHVRALPEGHVPGSRRETATELKIDGKKVPVIVEEEFDETPDGKRKEVRVRVLGPAPPGADVRPHPGAPRDGRDEVIRKLEEEVRHLRELLKKEGRDAVGEAEEQGRRAELEAKIADLRMEEARLKDKFGDRHPEMQAVRRKIEVLRTEPSDADFEGLAESLKELDLDPEKREAIERAVRERVEEAKARAEEAMRQAEELREAAERAREAAEAAREETENEQREEAEKEAGAEAEREAADEAKEEAEEEASGEAEEGREDGDESSVEGEGSDEPESEAEGESAEEDAPEEVEKEVAVVDSFNFLMGLFR